MTPKEKAKEFIQKAYDLDQHNKTTQSICKQIALLCVDEILNGSRLFYIEDYDYWKEVKQHIGVVRSVDVNIMGNQILNFEYEKGVQKVQPTNDLVKNWVFKEDEHDEAALAHFMGKIAQKNGLSANDMMHLYPYVLRMLKSDIDWAQNTKEK